MALFSSDNGCGVLMAVCALALPSLAYGDSPFFREIPPAPGYAGGSPWGISADGRVVVGAAGVEGGVLEYHAFRWPLDGQMEMLGSLEGERNSDAYGVSADGSVVVGWGAVAGGVEAFRWTATEGMVGLGDLAGGSHASEARGVSADGRVVAGVGRVQEDLALGVIWRDGEEVTPIEMMAGAWACYATAVSADGAVVVGGVTNAEFSPEAFRWTEDDGMVGLGDLPGWSFSSGANGVSADGSVVVGTGLSHDGFEAFRWSADEGMTGLGFLTGTYSEAYAVSADGSAVVGKARGSNGRICPFIWTAKEGMRNLQDVVQYELGLDLGEIVELGYATAVSGDGRTIVGRGFTRDGQTGGWVAYLGPGCRVDRDQNELVDTRDVTEFLNIWAQRSILADWNYDAVVDIRDVIGFLNAWVEGCE